MPPFIGQIVLLPFNFAPAEWSFCDGRLLSIFENEYLFTILGTTFGGDGENTFGLPDLRAVAPKECNYCIALAGYAGQQFHGAVGETLILATAVSSRNLAECVGQSLPTAQYRMLEAFMGTRFGGDGKNNFNLPDLRSIAPAKCRYAMAVQGIDPNAPGDDTFVGELVLLPYELKPGILRLCDGSLLQIAQNTALFSLLGTRFGGDGKTTFALPDLRAAAPSKFNYYIRLQGTLAKSG